MGNQQSATVAVIGLKETLRALDRMSLRERKETRRELYKAAVEVADVAREYVDPDGLSGWRRWKGGYEPARIKAGIRLTRMTYRYKQYYDRSMIGVVNSSAAGAIWELAGRGKKRRQRTGRRMEMRRVLKTSKRTGRTYMGSESTGNYRRGGWGNGPAFIAGIQQHASRTSRTQASRMVWFAYEQTMAGDLKARIERMVIREGKTTQRAIDLGAAKFTTKR